MNFDNALAAANHMLEKRGEFQIWTTSRAACWHRRLLASAKTPVAVYTLLGVGGCVSAVLFVVGIFNIQDGADLLATSGCLLPMVFFAWLLDSSVTPTIPTVNWFNPVINHFSKKYGVRFNGTNPQKLWGECPQELKTTVLEQLRQLDDKWSTVTAQVLEVINNPNLPYVWWENVHNLVASGLEEQQKNSLRAQRHRELLQLQTHMHHELENPTVAIEHHNDRCDPSNATHIKL